MSLEKSKKLDNLYKKTKDPTIKNLIKENYKVNLIIDNKNYGKYINILKHSEFKGINIIITIEFYMNYKFPTFHKKIYQFHF